MLSTASSSLKAIDAQVQSGDCDAKELLSIFNSTYDKATGTKDSQGETNVHISLANMFSLPASESTATQDTVVTVDSSSD